MIERYTLPEMGALWSEQNKFQKWLDVELAVCDVHAEMGTIPREAAEEWRRAAPPDESRAATARGRERLRRPAGRNPHGGAEPRPPRGGLPGPPPLTK